MRWSQSYIYTLKESPSDAEIPSHKLMIRAGFIRKLAQGIYIYGPLALKALKKFEVIVREEHNKAGCIELLMPMVHPKELWEETGRWNEMGAGLLKFKNRTGQEWCLGATHEEVITEYVRKDVKSYRDLPFTLYQIQTKYRDEIRPRFGLMRGREFIMKDAYSFDLDEASAIKSYEKMHQIYEAIFSRLGVQFSVVRADSGNIGGNLSQEFHILAENGEDQLLVSEDGRFAANVEVCPAQEDQPQPTSKAKDKPLETFETLNQKTIADLSQFTGVPENQLVKTLFFSTSEEGEKDLRPVVVLLRGNDEANPVKLKNHLGLANPPLFLTDEEVKTLTGAWPGSCGPVGLPKNVPVYMDKGVESFKNYIVGANEDGKHYRNVNSGRDFQVTETLDLRMAKEGDANPEGSGRLKMCRGIEVGHIFYLGTKYSQAMGAQYLDPKGKLQPIEMGCYGIGVSRTIQAVIEQNHDKDGMIWPLAIAPFAVHICLLDPKDEEISKVAEGIYSELQSIGIECLLDDRDERPGVKFKDADLLGMPLRLTIGARGIKNGEVEWVERKTKEMKKIPLDQVIPQIRSWMNSK